MIVLSVAANHSRDYKLEIEMSNLFGTTFYRADVRKTISEGKSHDVEYVVGKVTRFRFVAFVEALFFATLFGWRGVEISVGQLSARDLAAERMLGKAFAR